MMTTSAQLASGAQDLPEGWAVTSLGEVCTRPQYGWTTRADHQRATLKILRTSDISRGEIDWSAVPSCAEEPPDVAKYLLAHGDIVVSRAGSVGLSSLICEPPRAVFASYLIRFRPVDGIEPHYVAAYLKSRSYWDSIASETIGIAIPNVNASKLAGIPIPLPPLAEQRRIAARVDELLARVNAARDRLARVQATMKRFRQAVLAAACSGRLTADWREELGEVGGGSAWPSAKFGDVTINYDGRRVPVRSDDRMGMQGQYPYYGASGVIDYVNRYLFDGDYLLVAEDGANLLSRSTPIAFDACGKFWVNNHAHVVQPRTGADQGYLRIYLNSLDLQEWVTGSAQPKLTQAKLNSIRVPLPPLAEQHEIVRRVEALLELAKRIEPRVAAASARAERLTQAVLAKAFRGELVPTEAELARREGRAYEPAAVLLARVRAEHSAATARTRDAARRPRRAEVKPVEPRVS